VEDVERKVILARGGVFVFVHTVRQRRVEGYLLRCDGRVLVLKEFCPCDIDGWTGLSEVQWEVWVHLSVYRVACFIEEEKVVELDCSAFVWKRRCGNCS
jgi:hypothetical protein